MGGGYGMRGPMNPMMRGGRGGGGMAGVKPVLTLADVQGWLEKQQPFVLQTVMKTCTSLLVTKHDAPAEDLTDWYSAAEAAGDAVEEEKTEVVSPPVQNKGTLLSGGVDPLKSSNMLRTSQNSKPGLAWTRSDLRHPHKVTAQMRPLPEMDIIPPFSAENKEADVDRDKRKMLTNNVNMMQMEVNKICHRFKIAPATLDRSNLDKYGDKARVKLKVALTCVKNAERTLTDFLDFLKTDKYKEWNEEQKAKREELLKSMIGEAPKGRPHASGIKEDDIDLVDAEAADVDERIKKTQKKRGSDNEEEEEEDGDEDDDEDDDDDGEPKEKRAKSG